MSKEDAIAQLVPVFRRYGYEGTTLVRLSKATGLGKASLYHYFPGGKEEMAGAVLAHTRKVCEQTILDPLQAPQTPRDRLQGMVASIREFYRSGREPCLLAVLSLGEGDDLFGETIQDSIRRWIGAIAVVLEEAGIEPERARERAEDAIVEIQGALVLVRILGQTDPFERILKRLPEQLLGV